MLFQCVRNSLKSVNSAGLSGSGSRAFDGSRTFFRPHRKLANGQRHKESNKLDIWICICILQYVYIYGYVVVLVVYIHMYVLHLYVYIESISRSISINGSRAQPSRGTEFSNAGE